jgi:hypothetical protein
MKRFKFFGIVIILAVIAGAAVFYIRYHYGLNKLTLENSQPIVVDSGNPPPVATSVKSSTTPPSTLLLKVPFTPQAPTANWDQVHNEDCEEAVSVMAYEYYSGNKAVTLAAPLVETELTKLNNWETNNLGYNLDTTSAETAQMIQKVYGLQTQLLNNFTAQDIKNQLDQNHLVIVSEDGQDLNNPNYKQPGPLHHMLLIKGYTPEGFVTNDSGTRNGLNYFYTFNTIYNAAGDWDHTTNNVNLNKKIAIAVWK